MKLRGRTRWIAVLLVIVVAGVGVSLSLAKLRGTTHGIPTARVTRGDVDLKVYADGLTRSPNTSLLMAPPVNGTLQIVKLVRTGDMVHAGDVVLEFDPSEQEYNLEQAQSQLEQADQQILKTKADGDVAASKDQVDLLHARYDVRRAELDVSQNELKSAIDAKKNDLALEEAKRRLAQLEQDVQSRAASSQANLAVYLAQKSKAQLDIKQAQDHIASMTIKAPISGIFSRKFNTNGLNFWGPGITVPEYQLGDQTFPGSAVATILDVSSMEISSDIPEISRADINEGDAAEIYVDATPENALKAKVKTIAGLASGGDFGSDSSRNFNATFELIQQDAQMRPGETTKVVVQGQHLKDVLFLPRQALFMHEGKPVVFAKSGAGFEAHTVTIKHVTESQVVIEGLAEGTYVALVNPETTEASSPGANNPTTKTGGK